jgi:hypothetical protein
MSYNGSNWQALSDDEAYQLARAIEKEISQITGDYARGQFRFAIVKLLREKLQAFAIARAALAPVAPEAEREVGRLEGLEQAAKICENLFVNETVLQAIRAAKK